MMPPPMTMTSAWAGSASVIACRDAGFEAFDRLVGAAQIFVGVGGIVGARRLKMDFRNHGPDGLAQRGRDLHGVERALELARGVPPK